MDYLKNQINHKSAIARSFSRAAGTYDQASIVQREIGCRLLERLDLIKLNPALILDLGGGTGFLSRQLAQRYPKANVVVCDIAEGMVNFAQHLYASMHPSLSFLCADGDYLPFQDQSVDFVFSNCALQWFTNPKKVFQEIYRVLKPNGLLLFSTFGQDTLKELRSSFANIDNNTHVNTFMDMHDIGDSLLHQKFQDPVMDMETLTLTYKNLRGLIDDLKLMGAHYVHSETPRGLSPRGMFDKLSHHYEAYRTEEGLLPATFEIVYGHAWTPEISLEMPACQKTVKIPITTIEPSELD